MDVLKRIFTKSLSGSLSASGTLTTRRKHSMSRQHLAAASYFAANSQELEATVSQPTEEERSHHRAYVTGAILSSVAFLEASINELFLECIGNDTGKLGPLQDAAKQAMAEAWPSVERRPILEKYQHALVKSNLREFKKGRPPYQDASSLVALRNALVHYTPEWDDEETLHDNLRKRLSRKFEPNPFAAPGTLWFPHVCLGAGCASWATDTARRFSQDFTQRMGIPTRT
jgi:hypothetical protein